jgi:hypothetical protein
MECPVLVRKLSNRLGAPLKDVPQRTTVEQMTRELGVIANLQVSELAMKTSNLTLGFDATTRDGKHVNSIHFPDANVCHVVAVDHLAGGTAEDYTQHVVESVDHLAKIYSDFQKRDFQQCRSELICNISNTTTDRASVNHATVEKIKKICR